MGPHRDTLDHRWVISVAGDRHIGRPCGCAWIDASMQREVEGSEMAIDREPYRAWPLWGDLAALRHAERVAQREAISIGIAANI
ncbi:hypothetical protein [Rhizorhabdus argentea]|uniref:hypothetical protein n=1 Tax=Rhizorhabdus argentea TaxID=1387174 RepID=UPI0030EC0FC1